MSAACPCGTGDNYVACCGRFHDEQAIPDTAEQLMRSRYSAFAKSAVDYLEATLHPDKRINFDRVTTAEWCRQTTWVGLEINGRQKGSPKDSTGKVTFTAHFLVGAEARAYRETSFFKKLDGRWYYVRALSKT